MSLVMNTFDQSVRAAAGQQTKNNRLWPLYGCLLFSVAFSAGGCVQPYAGPAPAYGAAYAPAVAPASISVEIGDRPYYTRGPGYYVGPVYYVWRPGHWIHRQGHRVWIHGHYVRRG